MIYLAHSAKDGIPEQHYERHVVEVLRLAEDNASKAASFSTYSELLKDTVKYAAVFHDLGKLDPQNQDVLKNSRGALPIKHWDAGSAYLLSSFGSLTERLAALFVYSHHRGLPSLPEESAKGRGNVFRETDVKEITDDRLKRYFDAHCSTVKTSIEKICNDWKGPPPPSLFFRIALSCLVDADHTDTARHYNNAVPEGEVALLPNERLQKLDLYVDSLAQNASGDSERIRLRQHVYTACRNAPSSMSNIIACDSPVGTGKTTAVMAHLLNVAKQKQPNLRRVFVVLPYTNIIEQSVDVYRKALVLKSEKHEKVIAAHHHRAEFEDINSRVFSFLWNAPVTVTTAVQFFETLASKQPAALRKLHHLPGSAIFIDEAHAALPAHLWPQAWKWLQELAKDWGCYIVMASGSLTKFWELEEFSSPTAKVSELVIADVRSSTIKAEKSRIQYRKKDEPLDLEALCEWVQTLEKPRLLILNTVHSAAAVAKRLAEIVGRAQVEHLSTSLAPIHRKRTLERIKERLSIPSDFNWTLVATSCVEAGVDFSFRSAAREFSSLVSTIQTAGRINRSNEHGTSELWNFTIIPNNLLKTHPAFKDSSDILNKFYKEDKVCAEYCKEAMKIEVRQRNQGLCEDDPIVKADRNKEFLVVNEKFRVIESNTVTAIIDQNLCDRIERREKISPSELQQKSVNIYTSRGDKYALKPFDKFPGLYKWMLDYDDFLGYMAGALSVEAIKQGITCLI